VRSHIGREWMAMRDMDVAASVIGIRPVLRQAHGLCRQFLHRRRGRCAVGLCHLGSWEPAAFNIDRSFHLLFMVIIGGLGSIMGSFFGAAFIVCCRSS
jgi:branched-chain amino acid transport system permease protein